MRTPVQVCLSILLSTTLASALTISGTVTNVGESGDVYLALVEDLSWDKEPVAGLILDSADAVNGRLAFTFTDIEPGSYGIMVFQDEDGDGDLDTGLFGPTEPWGNYRESRPIPHLAEILFPLKEHLSGIVIELD
ncbi:MAG: DUF2141 domain-containing protein [Candidatus Coatesbacteria bacterium]|nr:DUF2141 domain-containing protein [Candidatus Coatesbacteria bacterium]